QLFQIRWRRILTSIHYDDGLTSDDFTSQLLMKKQPDPWIDRIARFLSTATQFDQNFSNCFSVHLANIATLPGIPGDCFNAGPSGFGERGEISTLLTD